MLEIPLRKRNVLIVIDVQVNLLPPRPRHYATTGPSPMVSLHIVTWCRFLPYKYGGMAHKAQCKLSSLFNGHMLEPFCGLKQPITVFRTHYKSRGVTVRSNAGRPRCPRPLFFSCKFKRFFTTQTLLTVFSSFMRAQWKQ